MAAKKILKEDRSKGNDASVKDKDKGKEKEYDNKSLGVDNKNPDNKDLKNTVSDIEKEIEKAKAPIIPEQKITNFKTYGSDNDYIVVETVGKYRNIWNYITNCCGCNSKQKCKFYNFLYSKRCFVLFP